LGLFVVYELQDVSSFNGIWDVKASGNYLYITAYLGDSFLVVDLKNTTFNTLECGNIKTNNTEITESLRIEDGYVKNGISAGVQGIYTTGKMAGKLSIVSEPSINVASAAGTTNSITWDSDYVYVCVAKDTWKRFAVTTW